MRIFDQAIWEIAKRRGTKNFKRNKTLIPQIRFIFKNSRATMVQSIQKRAILYRLTKFAHLSQRDLVGSLPHILFETTLQAGQANALEGGTLRNVS